MSYKLNLCFPYNGHNYYCPPVHGCIYNFSKLKDRWHDMYDFTWVRYEK